MRVFSRLVFGNGRSLDFCLPRCRLCPRALLLLKQAVKFDTAHFASGSDSDAFGLSFELGRACRNLCRPVGIEERRLDGC